MPDMPTMENNFDALAALDADAFYDELAATLTAYGFAAVKEDTGGGVLAVTIALGGREVTVGGVQDGFLVLASDDNPDGFDLSLAECVGRALVQRINLDELDK